MKKMSEDTRMIISWVLMLGGTFVFIKGMELNNIHMKVWSGFLLMNLFLTNVKEIGYFAGYCDGYKDCKDGKRYVRKWRRG